MESYMKQFLQEGTSFPEISYPSLRKANNGSTDDWIEGKILDDGAEGLWRIHDRLYDFTDFVNKHPGGESWLSMTKGTDITEAFESHHVSTVPDNMLGKFYVRDANGPRHSPFTFRDDGFYRTLKARVRDELKTIPVEELEKKTRRIIECLFLSALTFSVVTCSVASLYVKALFCLLTAFTMTWTVNTAHNFIHRKDNWRMYLSCLMFLPVREWRIVHALSHHLYPNTLFDLEMSLFEPFFVWMPRPNKNFIMRYAPRVYAIFVYIMIFDFQLLRRIVQGLKYKKNSRFHFDDLVPMIFPLAMYICGNEDLTVVIVTWLVIGHMSSLLVGVINLHAAHHHPEIFHDGDIPRSDRDWGLFQIDAVADRVDVNSSFLVVLTHFGEHTLHHLFPTLDHSALSRLHPVFAKTCDEFKTKIRMTNQLEMFVGYYKQLAKIEPKNFNQT